jgi:hypothetical protein
MHQRNPASSRKQQQRNLQQHVQNRTAVDFFNVLTGPQLLEFADAHLPEHRERLYPPTVTLSMFIQQVLAEDSSCQRAVNGWAAQRLAEGLSTQSVRTGAYCRARARLPLTMIQSLVRETGRILCTGARNSWCWRGRAVKLVDGTGISMPDTPDNQAHYPQPSTQAPGAGFPQAQLVGVLCLATGALLDSAMGPCQGKGHSEHGLLRQLLGVFESGDVLLADALYCNYWLLAALQSLGVDAVFKQHGSRSTDFRRGQQVGSRDHIVCWAKPKYRPRWMTPEQHRAYPETLRVREVKVKRQVLVTTLLDHHAVSKQDLSALYDQRWNVELDLRNIKTTLGMDVLRCHSAQMIEKELWVHLLAYNLLRLLMAQAAVEVGIAPREISFKHTLQIWVEWLHCRKGAEDEHQRQALLILVAQIRVGRRPGRIEPRACKRRPKCSVWLKVPREQARQQIKQTGTYLPNG